MTATVTSLYERGAPVAPPDGSPGVCDWLTKWVEGLRAEEYGRVQTLALVIENTDGELAIIQQSIENLDRARLLGLLYMAMTARQAGGARIEDMQR